MYFSKALNSMFATHPPLPERIARVEGLSTDQVQQQLSQPANQSTARNQPTQPTSAELEQRQQSRKQAASDVMGAVILGSVLDDAVDRIGSIDAAGLEQSRRIMESIPEALNEAAHSTATARHVVFAILLDAEASDRAIQWNRLQSILPSSEIQNLKKLEAPADQLDPWARLPLLDLCIPALSQLSDSQYKTFRETIDAMIRADGSIDRWEWVVDTVLDRHLEERYHKPGAERKARSRLQSCSDSVQVVLATLACTGAEEETEARASFQQGMNSLGWQGDFPDPASLKMTSLRKSLRDIRRVRFTERADFIRACEATILHDGQTTIEEAETLRAISESIDCPMPPFRQPAH